MINDSYHFYLRSYLCCLICCIVSLSSGFALSIPNKTQRDLNLVHGGKCILYCRLTEVTVVLYTLQAYDVEIY